MAWIVPSVLAADFVNLERDIRWAEKAGVRMLHLDVMDGHFVPNVTFGGPVIRAIRKTTSLLLDVHLMISNAETTFEWYVDAGADYLSVHYEAVSHLDRLLDAVQERGVKPGVVLNPHTPVHLLEEVLPQCHHVLLMSVNPGFGGQSFIQSSLEKTRKLRKMIESRDLDVKIEMDGGIGPENIGEVAAAGVDLAVAGSAIFRSHDPAEALRQMQGIAGTVGVN